MPTIEEYQKLRKAQKSLNKRLLNSLPKAPKGRAMLQKTAKELGYRVKGDTIVFASEESVDRLFDFLIYEVDASGQSVARRFLASDPVLPLEESLVLGAVTTSTTSLYGIADIDAAHNRFLARDLLHDRGDLWITDIGLSSTITRRMLLFGRVFEVGGICFVSGSGVCFDAGDTHFLLMKYKQLEKIKNVALRSRKRYVLFMRLALNSSIEIRYE